MQRDALEYPALPESHPWVVDRGVVAGRDVEVACGCTVAPAPRSPRLRVTRRLSSTLVAFEKANSKYI